MTNSKSAIVAGGSSPAPEAWPFPHGTPQVEVEAAAWRLTLRMLAPYFDNCVPLDVDLKRIASILNTANAEDQFPERIR